jgi:hypothetical protein
MNDFAELDKRFSMHEVVCAERWKETILRIKRLEQILIVTAGSICMLLIGLLTKGH